MTVEKEAGPRLDVDTLRHAVEDRDSEAMLSLFTEDAEYELINRNAPPGSPHALHGREEIGAAVRDVFSRDMTHELVSVVIEEDHAAYEELCTYPDGSRVLAIAMLDLTDGRIASCRTIEAWDE
ncbi:nuclear transport factor 2 family protein [Halostreptopolyspora alba]|uniref:nuclear transport factor 2 family protein n=1 Tax=Halostreptopolyspora alba TaxID=2487137 RepID=UPI00267B2FD3